MRLTKRFQDISIEIFKNIFTPRQIEEMIAADLSEDDNILNLPTDKYFEKRYYIGDNIIGDNDNAEADPNEIVLASYTLMNVPSETEPLLVGTQGIITFYKDNIKLYVVSLIDCLNLPSPLGFNCALYIHYFVMADLLFHEGCHHYCDVKRQLTGSLFDINTEEPLSVAHSYNQFSLPFFKRGFNINYYFLYEKFIRLYGNHTLHYKISNQNKILFEFLMTEHFTSYQSDVYVNWQLFTHKNAYKTDFYDYIKNSQLDQLLACGVPVNDIAKEIDFIGIEGVKLVVE
jgi:hypothetical protein